MKPIEVERRTKSWQQSHLQLPLSSQVLRLPLCPSATGRLTTTSSAGINADAYLSLRSQVQHLKTEQKQVLGARRAAKQVCISGVSIHCTFFRFGFEATHVYNYFLSVSIAVVSMLLTRCVGFQLENLAYLQHQNEAQQQEEAYLDKISKLQTSLQEANERSGKIRQQYERYFNLLTRGLYSCTH